MIYGMLLHRDIQSVFMIVSCNDEWVISIFKSFLPFDIAQNTYAPADMFVPNFFITLDLVTKKLLNYFTTSLHWSIDITYSMIPNLFATTISNL